MSARSARRRGLLVLADGTMFEGEAIGSGDRPAPVGGRGRVQHRPHRLPGGAHRPVLRRPDHHLHLPPHRQLRGHRRRRREPRPVLPGGHRPRPDRRPSNWRATERPRRLPAPPRPGRHRRGRHPAPDPPPPRRRGHARRLRPSTAPAPRRGCAAARPRPSRAPTASTWWPRSPRAAPYTVGDGPCRVVAYDFGIKRTILRHLGQLATVEVVPASHAGGRGAGPPARRGVPVQRPGRPRARCGYATDAIGELLGPGARLRHLPGPPAAGAALGGQHLQAALRPPRRQPPGAPPGDRQRSRSPARTTTTPCPTSLRDRRRGHPPSTSTTASSRGCEPPRCRPSACSTTPRPGPAPTTPATCSPSSPSSWPRRQTGAGAGKRRLMPRRDDIESILVIGSGPDRHRPGLRVRLLGHPGLPGAARARATGSSWPTPTRPRS